MEPKKKTVLRHNSRYFFRIGLTAFLTVAAIILFFFFIFRIKEISDFISKIITILQPVIVGIAIAYLIGPIQVSMMNGLQKLFARIFKKKAGFKKASKFLSITFALLLFVCFIVLFCYLVVPSFVESIQSLIPNIPAWFDKILERVNYFIDDNASLVSSISEFVNSQKQMLTDFITKSADELVKVVADGVVSVVVFAKDFVIGIMVAAYVMASKETFKMHFQKILCATFKEDRVKSIIKVLRQSNTIFGGFITGKLLNALIIGIICFIGVTILRIPYPMLISVIIAVTDIIPIFGPYIGTIPCALIILLSSPIKCLYFVIFIILLQMLDANIIGPKILGESTGLSSFWVIIAIIVGGGLFGVLGMLLGVPVFAVIYYILKTLLNKKLQQKNLPVTSAFYEDIDKVYYKGSIKDEEEPSDAAE